MNQVSTLFGARRRAFHNARAVGAVGFRAGTLAAVAAVCAAVLLVGELAAPGLLLAPADTATPVLGGRAPVAGDRALEAAFWLSCLLSMFFSFRTMESMFRSAHVRALELLPVQPAALFAERVANTAAEGLLLGAAAALFFVPLVWHGAWSVTLLAGALLLVAMLVTGAATLGINAWFGAQWGGSSSLGDAYGGQGGAFIYAPMMSLTVSVVANFMLQLGAREVLHDGRVTNAALLASGIGVALGAGALAVGARHFVQSYHMVAAFFREADDVGFEALLDYQQSAWEPVRFESLAGAGAILFRRHAKQFGRRFAVGRSLAMLGSIAAALAAFAFTPDVYPGWLAALLPAVFISFIARAFTRIADPQLGGASDEVLGVSGSAVRRATVVWWLVEALRIAVPFGVLFAAARLATSTVAEALLPALFALVVAVACVAAVALVSARTSTLFARTVACVLTLLTLGVVGATNVTFGVLAGAAMALLIPLSFRTPPLSGGS